MSLLLQLYETKPVVVPALGLRPLSVGDPPKWFLKFIIMVHDNNFVLFFRKLFSKWKTGNSVQRKVLVKSGHRVLCAAVEEKQVKDLLMIFGFRPEYHSQNFTNGSFLSYPR